jgi:hypothetical protein
VGGLFLVKLKGRCLGSGWSISCCEEIKRVDVFGVGSVENIAHKCNKSYTDFNFLLSFNNKAFNPTLNCT